LMQNSRFNLTMVYSTTDIVQKAVESEDLTMIK
jgi:hypothetical protein